MQHKLKRNKVYDDTLAVIISTQNTPIYIYIYIYTVFYVRLLSYVPNDGKSKAQREILY